MNNPSDINPRNRHFKLGWNCFFTGRLTNPYRDKESIEHKEWERGFNKAYFKNLANVEADPA